MSKPIVPIPSQALLAQCQIGTGDYEKIGRDYLDLFKDLGHLTPREQVLDIGCGLGRMAVSLLSYLKSPWHRKFMGKPAYVGLDINETSINWCQKHIAPLFPDVVFGWMDVYNPFYNPKGTQTPSAYRFPFPDGSFDFIFLTSVFTHMRPDGAINYLREINRLLRDGGRCFTTYFILNETSRQLILENKGTNLFIYGTKLNIPSFPCRFDGFYAEETEVPEKIIAFDESDVRSLHEAAGLPISGEIHYGCWCGRENYTSYQDIVIAEKKKGNIHHSVGIH